MTGRIPSNYVFIGVEAGPKEHHLREVNVVSSYLDQGSELVLFVVASEER